MIEVIIIMLLLLAGGALSVVTIVQRLTQASVSPVRRFLLNQTKLERQSEIKEGSISLTHGFLPSTQPLLSMPSSHKAWDDIAEKIPTLLKKYQLKSAVDILPVLSASSDSLEDKYLGRASVILSALAHAYCFQQQRIALPDSIEKPWQEVSARLNRQGPMRTATDDFLYNWKLINQNLENPMQMDNLEQLVPYFYEQEDRIVGMVIVLCEHAFVPALPAICDVHDGCLNGNANQIINGLETLTQVVKNITEIYAQISPNPAAKFYVNPSVWAKTFALIGNSAHEGELGNSGINLPLFHVLDAFIGRKNFNTNLGIQMQERAKYFPKNYHSLINLINSLSITEYINKSVHKQSLHEAFQGLLNSYTGPKGFFAVHGRVAVSYVKLAMELGRTATNNEDITGSSLGCPVEQKWQKINNDLISGTEERKGTSCPFDRKMAQENNKKTSNDSSYSRIDVMMKNNPQKSIWCVNDEKIFDLTPLIKKHPGGDSIIISDAGLNITNTYSAIHHMQPHLIKRYYVGQLSLFSPNKHVQKLSDILEKLTKFENVLRNNFGYNPAFKVSFRMMEPSLLNMFVNEPAAIKSAINEFFNMVKPVKRLPIFPNLTETFSEYLITLKNQYRVEELGNDFLQTRKEAIMELVDNLRNYIYSYIKSGHPNLDDVSDIDNLSDNLYEMYLNYENSLSEHLNSLNQESRSEKYFLTNSISI